MRPKAERHIAALLRMLASPAGPMGEREGPMDYFFIKTYDEEGDYNYYVFAVSEERARQKLNEYWDECALLPKTIYFIKEIANGSDVLEANLD